MTTFIYEHLTSGALAAEPFSSSLMQEGDAMLQALCRDLMDLGQQICILRDVRLPALESHTGLEVITITSRAEYLAKWQQCQQHYQQFIVIAPETDGILQALVTELEQRQKHHLGSSAQAIRLCTDKLACGRLLQDQGLLTPDSFTASDWLRQRPADGATWIIKPVDGAGCEQTFKLDTAETRLFLSQQSPATRQHTLVQPYIHGEAFSLSLFINGDVIQLMSVNRQHMVQSGQQLQLLHCEPGCDDLIPAQQALKLARQIHAKIPGLWGFIGIDLVRSDDALWVIEINPRLTSSYAEPKFRQKGNPALALHQSL